MENMNQPSGTVSGATTGTASGPTSGTGKSDFAQAQPQAGGMYQYVPGAGFVQVQGGADTAAGTQQAATQQPGYGAGDAAAQNAAANDAFKAAYAAGMQAGMQTGMQMSSNMLQPGAQPGSQAASQAAAQAASQSASQSAAQAGMGTTAASDLSGMYGQGTPDNKEPKFDQNKLGQMYGVVEDFMNGEADPSKIFGLLQDSGGDFWKGAIVGAAAVFLLNNDAVKGAVAGTFGSVFGGKAAENADLTPDD